MVVRQKHIVVVDGLWVGHHPVYVKTFARLLLHAGYQVTVLCPAPGEVTSWVDQAESIEEGRFKAYEFSEEEPRLLGYMPSRFRNAFLSLARWWHISRSVKALCPSCGRPDLVFFAWLDSYLSGYLSVKLIDWQFPFLWSGLYFHPRHLRALGKNGKPTKGWFALPESFVARSKWASSVAVLDAGVLSVLCAKLHGKPAVALPDFTDELPPSKDCPLAEDIKLKARGRAVIGLLGRLARRKGLLTLIKIVQQSTENDWYFVFVGVLQAETFSKEELVEVQSFFHVQRDDCFFHLSKIPDDAQFNAVMNVCDVIFAMYENFPHSSNLMTKTAIYGKRILVSTGGYMEEVVKDFALGESVPSGDAQAAIDALRRLTDSDHPVKWSPRMRKYAVDQSQERLQSSLINLIESSMDRWSNERDFGTTVSPAKLGQ